MNTRFKNNCLQFLFQAVIGGTCFFSLELGAADPDLALELNSFDLPREGVVRIVRGGGPRGGEALLVQAERPNWAGTLTRMFSLPTGSVAVDLRGEMKVTDVAGGRMTIPFSSLEIGQALIETIP